jgi:hypothetical protein
LTEANDTSVPPHGFQRDPHSASSFGADDRQGGSIGKTIVGEIASCRSSPIEKSQSVKSGARTLSTPICINLIFGEASADQISDRVGSIEWVVPKESGQHGPSGVAFKEQHCHA